jgi:rhamnulose-1-phosphate aldolase
MNLANIDFIDDFIKTCQDGWLKGWHERNGGNLSYRLSTKDIETFQPFAAKKRELCPIGTKLPSLANDYFLITGSGKYMRNVSQDPASNIGIIKIDEHGENYRIIWGLLSAAKPSSELPTHLMSHAVKKDQNPEDTCAILHAHPPNIIALSFVLPLESCVFSKELWEMLSECAIVFPEGIGIVPWMVPGGLEIAQKSSELMKSFNAILWAHHGIFCAGASLDLAFGLTDTIEKSAEILVKVLSMGGKKQYISKNQLEILSKTYQTPLRKEFLD